MSTTTAPTFAARFFDENIRIDKILWIDGNAGSTSEFFDDFFDMEDTEVIAEVLGITKAQVKKIYDRWDKPGQNFAEWFADQRKAGFIVLAATPVPQGFHATGFSFSWGHCYLKWFYTPALDAAFVDKLVGWKNGIVEERRQKEFPVTALTKKKSARAPMI